MTVLSRGARVRRGGRRPGWLLLTTLLVLAIAASSALVFTNQVELLKLAVILALWAAVVAAFVSVIYRRQSDVDQARARDLKLVYDLQLDREISARREYELTVESQLRRELASELRAQAADEVAALRAELAALRTNLEILFDADLGQRPALESERAAARDYSDWARESESPRDRVNRVTAVRAERTERAEDSSIIDVPEEPLLPPPRPDGYTYQAAQIYPGSQWPQSDRRAPQDQQPSRPRWTPPEQYEPAHQQPPRHQYEAPPPPPELQRPTWATPDEPPRRQAAATEWQPAGAEGQWLPPGTPGTNWVSGPLDSNANNAAPADSATTVNEPRLAAPPRAEQRGRHSAPPEAPTDPRSGPPVEDERGWRYGEADQQAGARHSAESGAEPSRPEPVMAPPPEPVARHRSSDPT